MTTRSVSVVLQAVTSKFQADMARAKHSVHGLSTEISTASRKNKQDFQTLGMAGVAVGGALALGLGKVVSVAADFEKAMSGVGSVANASKAEMKALGDAAKAAGADVDLAGVTASSAAGAQMELVKAGVSVSDVLGGALKGSLSLAVAGQLDMADAATIAAQSMNLFQLEGEDVGHVADVMAAAANKSAADVSDLGQALQQGGLLAAQTGLSLEETVGTLAAFAGRALIGSDAGTSLKTMLQRLTPVSAEAQGMFDQLGFSAFDATGNFVGMEELAGRLQTAMADMSTEQRNAAMNVMFGSDAVRGANVLMELGADGVRDYTSAVNDQGAASRMAAAQTDNLAGDVEALGGAVESLVIDLGENAQGPLRKFTQGLTGVVDAVSGLPEDAQTAVLAVGGLASAAGLAAGGFLLAAPRIVATKDALATLTTTMPKSVGMLRGLGTFLTGPYGLALAGAAVGVGYLFNEHRKGQEAIKEYTAAIEADSGALAENTRAATVNRLEKDGVLKLAQKMRVDGALVVDAVLGEAGAREKLNAILDTYGDGQDAVLDGDRQAQSEAWKLAAAVGAETKALEAGTDAAYRKAHALDATGTAAEAGSAAAWRLAESGTAVSESADTAATGMDVFGGAVGDVGGEMEDAKSAAELLKEAVEGLTQATITGDRAAIDYEAGLDTLRQTLKDNGDTLNINTAKGRENLSAVIDLTESIHEHVQARADEGTKVKGLRSVYDNHRQDLRETLRQAGLNKAEVRDLIKEYGLTPKQVETTLKALNVDETVGDLNRVKGAIEDIGVSVGKVAGEMRVSIDGQFAPGHFNMGGKIPGSGPDRDSVMIYGTPGEYVQNRRAVDYYGLPFMEGLNQRRIPREALGLNAGGPVSSSLTADTSSAMSSEPMPQWDLVQIGRFLQSQGARVSSHPAFGGISWGSHTEGSKHYSGDALDANFAAGESAYEKAKIAQYLPAVTTLAGGRLTENLHPFNAADHQDHWHLAMNAGGLVGQLPQRLNKGGAVHNPTRVKRIIGRANAAGTVEAYADAVEQIEDLARAWDEVIRRQGVAARKQELVNAIAKAGRVRDRVLDDPKSRGKEQRQAARDYREAKQALEEFLAAERQGNAERRVARQLERAESRAARAEEREARRLARAEERAEAQARRVENIEAWNFSQMNAGQQLALIQQRLRAERKGSDEWLRLMHDQQRLQEQIASAREQHAAEEARAVEEAREEAARHAAEMAREAEQAAREAADAERERIAERQRLVDDALSVFTSRQDALNAWFNPGQRQTVEWGNSIEAEVANFRSQIDMYEQWQDALASVRAAGLSDAAISMRGLAAGPQALGQLRQFASASAEQLAEYNRLVNASSQLTAGTATQVIQSDPQVTALLQVIADGVRAGGDIYIDGQRAGQILAPYVTSTQQIDARMARVT